MNPIKSLLGLFKQKPVVKESVDYNGYLLSDLDVYSGFKSLQGLMWSWWYRYERLKGGNSFNYLSDSRYRDIGRLLCRYNPIAIGILDGLNIYTIGEDGTDVQVVNKKGFKQTRLAQQGQDYLDAFMDREDWWDRRSELHDRWIRDGEVILRYFIEDDEITVRPVEPEYIVPPDGSLEWTFGFRNRPGDVEKIDAMCIAYGNNSKDGIDLSKFEIVDASEFYHFKRNVDRALKRGVTDFASTATTVEGAMKTLTNLLSAEAIRAATTYITEHPDSTPDDVAAYIAGQTTYTDTIGGGPGNFGTTVPVNLSQGVGDIHLPGTQKLSSPPTYDALNALNAINGACLGVGSRYKMPLWLILGDMSKNNSIDLGAESPFGKHIAKHQRTFCNHERNMMWRVLVGGVELGHLPGEILDECDVRVKGQTTFHRDPDKETARLLTLMHEGRLSGRDVDERLGIDTEQAQARIEEEGGVNKQDPAEQKLQDGQGAQKNGRLRANGTGPGRRGG